MFLKFTLIPILSLANYFVVTDIHYDIGYDPHYNQSYYCHSLMLNDDKILPVPTSDIQEVIRPLCDSSYSIANLTFYKMQQIDPSPDFIIILGDVIGHFTMSFMMPNEIYNITNNISLLKKTYINLKDLITHYFPNTQIIPTIGNNDALKDYDMPYGWDRVEYLDFIYTIWEPLTKKISQSFFIDGYYLTTTSSGHTVISLNSVIFTIKHDVGIDGQAQLVWLKEKLREYDNVIITMHIPPGPSLYNGGDPSWQDEYITAFTDIVKFYQDKISVIFAGHFHIGLFQLIENIPIIIHPSISPIFENNPGFRYYMPESGNFKEYAIDSYSFVGTWHEYNFESVYGYPLNYTKVYDGLESGEVGYYAYLERVVGFWIYSQPDYNKICSFVFGDFCDKGVQEAKKSLLCAIKNLTTKDYQNCLNGSQ